jgi:uncharacterized protein YbjT (DUF2867 family)
VKILVTGATSNIGRMLVDHLLAAGAPDVRALTNDPARAALPAGVEVVEGYLRRLDTVPDALEGVDRMYLAPTPDTVGDVVALARRAGVGHIVDLSGEPESWWGSVTRAVEEGGTPWTHLWPGDFMENTTIWAHQIRTTGTVREPYPDSATAPIAMDDIAAVAATALLEDSHAGRAYTLTGPETLTRVEMVRRLGDALGLDVPFVEVSRADAIGVLTPTMGANAEWYVDNVLGGFAGQPMPTTSTVEEITGRAATTFAQWAAAHADEFRAPTPA